MYLFCDEIIYIIGKKWFEERPKLLRARRSSEERAGLEKLEDN